MKEESKAKVTAVFHAAAGIATGAVSLYIGQAGFAVLLAVLVAYALKMTTEKAFGKNKASWWLGNGLMVFIFSWLDMWIFMLNAL